MKNAIVVKYDDNTIPKPIGKFVYIEEDGKFLFTQSFVMSSKNSEHDDELLRKLTVRNGDLEVEYMGEETKISRKYSDNTAFNTKGIVRKNEQSSFGVKQVYDFVCTGEIPSDETINVDAESFYTAGMQTISITVNYSTERIEMITFSGRYTVIRDSELTAKEHYESEDTGGKAYADDWLGDNSEDTYDLFEESVVPDQFGKSIDFKLTYRTQTLPGLASGVVQKAFLVDRTIDMEISRGKQVQAEKDIKGAHDDSTSAGGSPNVKIGASEFPKFYTIKAFFSIDRDKYSTTASIHSVYLANVRDWTIDYLKSTYSFTNAKVSYARDAVNPFQWQLVVEMFVFNPPDSNLLAYTIDEHLDVEAGEIWKKIADGKHFTYRIWGTGAEAVKAVSIIVVKIDSEPEESLYTNAIANYLQKDGEGEGWRPVKLSGDIKHRWRQTIDDATYEVYYKNRTYALRYAESSETAPIAIEITDALTGRNMFGDT